MKESKPGFYWHVHHEVLLEWCYDAEERREYIRTAKPKDEIETRLRLMTRVKGRLPKARDDASKAYHDACKAYDDARKAYDDAWKAYDDACKAYDDAWKAYDDAWKARDDACKAYDDACKATLPKLETLHAKEHPDCPWDGKTIFPPTSQVVGR